MKKQILYSASFIVSTYCSSVLEQQMCLAKSGKDTLLLPASDRRTGY